MRAGDIVKVRGRIVTGQVLKVTGGTVTVEFFNGQIETFPADEVLPHKPR